MAESKLEVAVARLDHAVAKLIDVVSGLPDGLRQPSEWGPREMLVHIVFAHELYAKYLRSTVEGREPPLFEGLYREQNARALSENANIGVLELISRLKTAHADLKRLVVRPATQSAPFYFKAGSKARSLETALGEVVGHIRGHLGDIRRLELEAAV